MLRLLLLLAVPVMAYGYWKYITKAPPALRKRRMKTLWMTLALGLVLWVAIRSGSALVGAMGAALVGVARAAPRVMHWLKALGVLSTSAAPPPPTEEPGPARMTRERALQILDLPPTASEQEILARYRTLMKNVHPDRGGSRYLAVQLNQAKDCLLSG